MDEFERTVAELETLFTDPEFKGAIDEVRLFNELLAEEPTSEADATTLIKAINKKWRAKGYYGKEMFVTGGVHIGGVYGDLAYNELDTASIAPLSLYPFISDGFSMVVSLEDEGGMMTTHQQIVMLGRIEYADDEEYSVDGTTNEACAIPLTPNTYIEFREITAPKAAVWLEMYYPDVKLLIDECMMQADNESEATINLRDTPLPTAEHHKKEAQRQKQAIQVYLDSLIEYEKYVPYIIELFGDCEIFDAQTLVWENKSIMSNVASMVIIQSLSIEVVKRTKEFQLFVQGLLLTSGKDKARNIKMPVQTIVSMESGRKLLRPPR